MWNKFSLSLIIGEAREKIQGLLDGLDDLSGPTGFCEHLAGPGLPGLPHEPNEKGIREHDDWKLLGSGARAHGADQLHAVDIRQHQIHQHRVRPALVEELQPRAAVAGGVHSQSVGAQLGLIDVGNEPVVFDDKDSFHDLGSVVLFGRR